VDGSAVKEELLGQSRFSGIRVRNDGEGAAAGDFALEI